MLGSEGGDRLILWTVVPPEVVMEGFEETEPVLAEVWEGGRVLVLEVAGPGQVRVERVISTDPADYLAPRLQPGVRWLP